MQRLHQCSLSNTTDHTVGDEPANVIEAVDELMGEKRVVIHVEAFTALVDEMNKNTLLAKPILSPSEREDAHKAASDIIVKLDDIIKDGTTALTKIKQMTVGRKYRGVDNLKDELGKAFISKAGGPVKRMKKVFSCGLSRTKAMGPKPRRAFIS